MGTQDVEEWSENNGFDFENPEFVDESVVEKSLDDFISGIKKKPNRGFKKALDVILKPIVKENIRKNNMAVDLIRQAETTNELKKIDVDNLSRRTKIIKGNRFSNLNRIENLREDFLKSDFRELSSYSGRTLLGVAKQFNITEEQAINTFEKEGIIIEKGRIRPFV